LFKERLGISQRLCNTGDCSGVGNKATQIFCINLYSDRFRIAVN
jgi:hypothetical protein